MGLSPVSIAEGGRGDRAAARKISVPGFRKRVSLKDLAVASRQLATNAGVPGFFFFFLSLLRALTILAEQTENDALRGVFDDVRSDVEAGSSLSDSVARHETVGFPD